MTKPNVNIAKRVTISSRAKSMRLPRKKMLELVAFVAKREKRSIEQLDVLVVDSREMAKMNRDYLDHEGSTDVITFDLADDGQRSLCGQLILCAQVARQQAVHFGHGVQKELLLYLTHGLLHLMDYDDIDPADREKMHARQEKLLNDFLALKRLC